MVRASPTTCRRTSAEGPSRGHIQLPERAPAAGSTGRPAGAGAGTPPDRAGASGVGSPTVRSAFEAWGRDESREVPSERGPATSRAGAGTTRRQADRPPSTADERYVLGETPLDGRHGVPLLQRSVGNRAVGRLLNGEGPAVQRVPITAPTRRETLFNQRGTPGQASPAVYGGSGGVTFDMTRGGTPEAVTVTVKIRFFDRARTATGANTGSRTVIPPATRAEPGRRASVARRRTCGTAGPGWSASVGPPPGSRGWSTRTRVGRYRSPGVPGRPGVGSGLAGRCPGGRVRFGDGGGRPAAPDRCGALLHEPRPLPLHGGTDLRPRVRAPDRPAGRVLPFEPSDARAPARHRPGSLCRTRRRAGP